MCHHRTNALNSPRDISGLHIQAGLDLVAPRGGWLRLIFGLMWAWHAWLLSATGVAAEQVSPEDLKFFEKKIRPVLVERCYECHADSGDDIEGGLRVDLRDGLLQGGATGAAVVPGKPQESLLIAALEHQRGLEMPPDERLSEDIIGNFKRWIRRGAPDPRDGPMTSAQSQREPAATAELWSLQRVNNPPLPGVRDPSWPRGDVDRFLLAEMESEGLRPVAEAQPETLFRRVSFDLIGLPPTPDEVRAFLADPSEAAYSAHVDNLLASALFGERWGRHWLDVVRYGESAGSSRDVLMTSAWRYRDYVIDAFNADVPYDRFVTEQIAGDLLEASTPGERLRQQVATGLLAIGSKSLNGGNLPLDIVDDQIDVIGKAILGLTVSCARCHDHKFDPIPTADYYSLAGIFRSTKTWYGGGPGRPQTPGEMLQVYLPLRDDAEVIARVKQHGEQLDELTKQQQQANKRVQEQRKQLPEDWQEQEKSLRDRAETPQDEAPLKPKEIKLLERISAFREARRQQRENRLRIEELEQQELPELDFAVGVTEAKKIADSPIHVRGEKNRTGDVVARGMLSCVDLELDDSASLEIGDRQSGRLELARWLTHPRNPLTPRVAVNQIWARLFGKGLVETTTDFGTNAPRPTHPDLLDHLAHRFVHDFNWSRKRLIRELVHSQAYRLSGDTAEGNMLIDEANHFYWRRERRRLEAEAIRDAMLAASRDLDLQRPVASPVAKIGEGEVGRNLNTKPLDEPYPYRSVYLPVIRGLIPEFLEVFDFPEPSNPQGERVATNVPAQSLFLMNNPFVIEQSDSLAQRLIAQYDEDRARIHEAYLRSFSRRPSDDEIEMAVVYLRDCFARLEGSPEASSERARIAWATFVQALFAAAEFRYLQ